MSDCPTGWHQHADGEWWGKGADSPARPARVTLCGKKIPTQAGGVMCRERWPCPIHGKWWSPGPGVAFPWWDGEANASESDEPRAIIGADGRRERAGDAPARGRDGDPCHHLHP